MILKNPNFKIIPPLGAARPRWWEWEHHQSTKLHGPPESRVLPVGLSTLNSLTMADYPYACEIDIAFPTDLIAQQTRDVMQVDKEIGDRVTKTFSLVQPDGGDKASVLRM
jgi:hypothetical protein